MAVIAVTWALTPYEGPEYPEGLHGATNPVGVTATGEPVVAALLGGMLLAAVVVGFASLVTRWRRAAELERQQLKWVLVGYACTIVLFAVVVGGSPGGADGGWGCARSTGGVRAAPAGPTGARRECHARPAALGRYLLSSLHTGRRRSPRPHIQQKPENPRAGGLPLTGRRGWRRGGGQPVRR
ncbi:hypothetical protein OG558_12855 [Kribbella sp. NBC_01510]|uniref:hypothetical protein n=1 Tax=Kribbella sp. NBC_01510 TaxID=2903581 RepID=UPI003866E496